MFGMPVFTMAATSKGATLLLFPAAENDFTFDLVAPNDPQQRKRLLLQGRPVLPDSILRTYVVTRVQRAALL